MPRLRTKTELISLDTETTGLDLRHGARPYFVTTCDEAGEQQYWEWDVDPLTREPQIPEGDLDEIDQAMEEADGLVLQNPKFDFGALQAAWPHSEWEVRWGKVWDTLLAGHLLASNQPHDLTSMALVYLGVNIQPLDDALKKACNEARRIARSRYPDWRIAKAGLPEMPSVKGEPWKYDGWLPRRIAQEEDYPDDHPWWTVLAEYGNGDSAVTLPLFQVMREKIKERGLWEIYLERLKVLPVVYQMESAGVTVSRDRLDELVETYGKEAEKAGRVCVNIAKTYDYELELPKSGNNKSLLEFVPIILEGEAYDASQSNYDHGKGGSGNVYYQNRRGEEAPKRNLIDSFPRTKTGQLSLNKNAIEGMISNLPPRSKARHFFWNLRAKRKRDTALNYMVGYRKFWLPLDVWRENPETGEREQLWYRLHPSLNPTGTDTLRWSSQNPNEQNISKQEGFNLRYCFGPALGREWWSLDAKNIELRLPAYEAGETEMIALFERPNEPPYFGSNHLLVFDILHPDKWDRDDPEGLLKAKKRYASTWYQWTKNGNFAVQYGAVEQSGTADRAYHVPGGQRRIQARFKKIKQLNDKMIAMAEKTGYVETMPDKTVNPERGYPLLCTRSKWGGIQPTVPLNYHVQGTAMWWMMKAMIRCQEYLDVLGPEYKMVMQVHDELVFDFPAGENLPKIRRIRRLMERGGDDLGVPTPVSIEHHPNNWSEGTSV